MRRETRHGFTLIEVIAVLVVLGVLAAVAIPRIVGSQAGDRVDAEVVKDAIRKTQMRAMSDLSEANWNIVLQNSTATINKNATASNSYQLNTPIASACTLSFNNFGGVASLTGTLPYSLSIDAETGFIP